MPGKTKPNKSPVPAAATSAPAAQSNQDPSPAPQSSTATPAPPNPSRTSPSATPAPANAASTIATSASSVAAGGTASPAPVDHNAIILEYLQRRGFKKAEEAFRDEISGGSETKPRSVTLDDFAKRNGPSVKGRGQADGGGAGMGGMAMERTTSPQVSLTGVTGGTAPGSVSTVNVGGHNVPLLIDPTSYERGYEALRDWIYNSLENYRAHLIPLLLPVFVHAYMDLVSGGWRDAADSFLTRFAADHSATHPLLIALLASLRTPFLISISEDATRWRRERYVLRMGERTWALVAGWLGGGSGGLGGFGIALGSERNFSGMGMEKDDERARERILAIVNERLRIDIVPSKSLSLMSEPSTQAGLESYFSIGPQLSVSALQEGSMEEVKLGLPPMDPKLEREVLRTVKEGDAAEAAKPAEVSRKDGQDADKGASSDAMDVDQPRVGQSQPGEGQTQPTATTETTQPTSSGTSLPSEKSLVAKDDQLVLISPTVSELPPYPPSFKTIDVRREVMRIREGRKRIRLGPEAFAGDGAGLSSSTSGMVNGIGYSSTAFARTGVVQQDTAKPSVCMFTVHDSGDSLISTEFSEDSSLLAAGFSESFIRLWNLKGEKMEPVRPDFETSRISTVDDLKKSTSGSGSTTRKLVGHSGPVYSLSFDPTTGPRHPPRYLLSASQDATVRLWSMETYSALVAYRGHRNPIWDVEWGPKGIYFATASRDRTARIWTTERSEAVRILAGHLSDVNCVRFHPNSLYVATGSSDRTCRLWDVQRGVCVRVFVGHSGSISSLAVSPNGRYLASASEDKSINLWDLASGRLLTSMRGHTSSIHSLAFSAESTVLVSGGADCTVRVWDVNGHQKEKERQTENGILMKGLGFSDGLSSGRSVGTGLNGARGSIDGLGSSSITRGLLTKSAQQEARKSSSLLGTLLTKRTPVYTVRFTPRNLCLAAGPMLQEEGT